jgi:hypothetical protein
MPEITSVDLERLSTRVKAFAEVLRAEHLALENQPYDNYWNKERNRFSDSKDHMERVLEQLTPYPEACYDSTWRERYELLRDYLDHVGLTKERPNERKTFDEFAHYHREQWEQPQISFTDVHSDAEVQRLERIIAYSSNVYKSLQSQSPSS